MAKFDAAFDSMADMNLWFKILSEDTIVMADIPSVIPLRWNHFKDNWEFFKQQLIDKIDAYFEPSILRTHITNMDIFINNQKTSPVVNSFSKRDILFKYYAVFDSIAITELPLTYKEMTLINSEISRVRRFTKNNFELMKIVFRQTRDELADSVSATDEMYNLVFNRSPVPSLTSIRINDINTMMLFHNSIKLTDYVLSNIYSLDTVSVDPFLLARSNANNSEISITQHQSGTLMRMRVGEDLISLASRTLGDPDVWIEIAIANGLKPPYIDEIGEKILLISNGSLSSVNLSSTDTNGESNISKLSINQILYIQSDVEIFPDKRSIQNIREIDVSGEIILELSGDQDLYRYKLEDNAYIRVYKPNTVNSSNLILIPSTKPVEGELSSETPFFLKGKPEDEKQMKVDLALGNDRDLMLTSSGDLQISYGMNNAVQAIRNKLEIEQGSMRRHGSYGLVNIAGYKADNPGELQSILEQSITRQVQNDPRFERIEQLIIQYANSGNDPSAFIVTLQVRLAGSKTVIPISFSVTN